MSSLLTLLDHVAWADAQVYAQIAGIDADRAERKDAIRLYSHVAGAEHVWLSRLQGRAPVHPVWPELSLEEAAALATESLRELRAIVERAPEALDQEVEYQTTTGHTFRNTVSQILAHVALHGSYHRGQIALLTRQGGGKPVATDYILFVRQ
jgi:uncharacterized damage-inducible protein DinB